MQTRRWRGVGAALATAALAATITSSPAGAAPTQAQPDEAIVAAYLTSGLSGCSSASQAANEVIDDRGTAELRTSLTCGAYTVQATTTIADVDPGDGFPWEVHVTNVTSVRVRVVSWLPPLPCSFERAEHEMTWPSGVELGSGVAGMAGDIPLGVGLCGAGVSPSVNIQVVSKQLWDAGARPPLWGSVDVTPQPL